MVSTPVGGGLSTMTGTINIRQAGNTGSQAGGMRGKIVSHNTGPSGHGQQMPANVVPLSARRSAPLDLNTVERRGEPSQVPEPEPKTGRVQDIEEAPTFRPTEQEWKDPMAYMRSIYEEGRKYGIVKLIPPPSWTPDFAIDTERFHFNTRKQELNMAEGGTRANITYLDALAKFHKQRNGTNLNRFPSVDKRPLDLYKLKKLVEEKGGFDNVCKQKRWAEVGRDLGYSGKIMSSLSTSLKNSYQKWLQPYEDWLKFNKPSVLQQQEIDNGGPYTPSPANSPMKTSQNANTLPVSTSSAAQASMALNAKLDDGQQKGSIEAPIAIRPASGFTPVNAGGFQPINAPASGFSAINAPAVQSDNVPDQSFITPTKSIDSPLTSLENTPENLRPVPINFGVSTQAHGHGSSPLKRQLSSDHEDEAGAEEEGRERRSKRLKKEAPPTVTGSYMNQPRLPTTNKLFAPRDRTNETPGEKCETCTKGDDRANMLFCEDCKVGYHRWCLDPPLKAVPEEEWFCPRCLVCCSEYGFNNGGIYSLKEFQEAARTHKAKHFRDKMPIDPATNAPRQPTEDEVEREFWRLTESLESLEPVEYGADIHSTTHGSGFPTLERDPYGAYTRDPWNLNILPLDKESLFRHIKTDICGMTVPWLYVGMCFSTFCWHSEDHYTYSANYQHFGATKTWYGIPADDADAFEAAMKEAVPDLFEQQPDLLFHLVTLLQPEKIRKAGVRVYALDQRAGQFVITFPRAYHAGFNHGFNFNEAVNFAPADWEPYGQDAVQRLQDFRRQPVFSHDELLFSAAQRDHSIKTAKWLGKALERTRDRELEVRERFTNEYRKAVESLTKSSIDSSGEDTSAIHFPFDKDLAEVSDEDVVCAYCKSYAYLSRFMCKKSKTVLCLAHAGKFECCDVSVEERTALSSADHVVSVRMTNAELVKAVQKVTDIADSPEAWGQKLTSLVESGPSSQLRNLRTLVTEGEKISKEWELPELANLKRYVDKCNDWVEEATTYITRKQQVRRKTERSWRKSSTKQIEAEDKERESRNVENIEKLLKAADELSFDCPELDTLREKATQVEDFRKRAGLALGRASAGGQELDELIEEGKTFGLDIPEIEKLEKKVKTVKWYEDAQEVMTKIGQGTCPSLQEITSMIDTGKDLGIPETDGQISFFNGLKVDGEFWESRAKELMAMEEVNFQQMDDLAKQASRLPVSKETLAAIDAMLAKQREAQDRIQNLYERSKEPDFRKRPMYQEVVTAMTALEELNSKPMGTIDLEREQKRHEDWMRKGKKLFGKTNAPLHILHQHMKFVEEKNDACLDLRDLPRMPVEPSSRANTPDADEANEEADNNGSGSVRDVFCICRKPEAGMMIECEMCHEWYHGKCLKIARGKVKEDDKYTCPICDYRVKIPRDAARPKVEELEGWQDEIPNLPFQPEEEDTLDNIINVGNAFRRHVSGYLNGALSTPDDLPVQRFYLRKIEGCELLLDTETNFFRQQVHRWAPVAPVSPPLLNVSLSTRKPRPTKLQKQMKEMGVTNVDDLPEHMRPKPPGIAKKKKYLADKDVLPIASSPSSNSDLNLARKALSIADSSGPHSDPPTAVMQNEGPPVLSESSITRPINPTMHRDQHQPSFSYGNDSMATLTSSAFRPQSPLFGAASQHSPIVDYRRAARSPSPPHMEGGIDPSLSTMFSTPLSGRDRVMHDDLDGPTQVSPALNHPFTHGSVHHRHEDDDDQYSMFSTVHPGEQERSEHEGQDVFDGGDRMDEDL